MNNCTNKSWPENTNEYLFCSGPRRSFCKVVETEAETCSLREPNSMYLVLIRFVFLRIWSWKDKVTLTCRVLIKNLFPAKSDHDKSWPEGESSFSHWCVQFISYLIYHCFFFWLNLNQTKLNRRMDKLFLRSTTDSIWNLK